MDDTTNNNNALNTLNSTLKSNQSKFFSLYQNNPLYTALKKQQDVIDKAINHLSAHHCYDLNASVVAVDMVIKKIDDAVGQAKWFRRQL